MTDFSRIRRDIQQALRESWRLRARRRFVSVRATRHAAPMSYYFLHRALSGTACKVRPKFGASFSRFISRDPELLVSGPPIFRRRCYVQQPISARIASILPLSDGSFAQARAAFQCDWDFNSPLILISSPCAGAHEPVALMTRQQAVPTVRMMAMMARSAQRTRHAVSPSYGAVIFGDDERLFSMLTSRLAFAQRTAPLIPSPAKGRRQIGDMKATASFQHALDGRKITAPCASRL